MFPCTVSNVHEIPRGKCPLVQCSLNRTKVESEPTQTTFRRDSTSTSTSTSGYSLVLNSLLGAVQTLLGRDQINACGLYNQYKLVTKSVTLYCNMDMPLNVPVDNPNADTEWQVCTSGLTARVWLTTDSPPGTTYCASMELSQRNLHPRHP